MSRQHLSAPSSPQFSPSTMPDPWKKHTHSSTSAPSDQRLAAQSVMPRPPTGVRTRRDTRCFCSLSAAMAAVVIEKGAVNSRSCERGHRVNDGVVVSTWLGRHLQPWFYMRRAPPSTCAPSSFPGNQSPGSTSIQTLCPCLHRVAYTPNLPGELNFWLLVLVVTGFSTGQQVYSSRRLRIPSSIGGQEPRVTEHHLSVLALRRSVVGRNPTKTRAFLLYW